MERITWESFLCDIKEIHNLSQQLNDDWEMIISNDDIGGTYLVKTKITESPLSKTFDNSNSNEIREELSEYAEQYSIEPSCESSSNPPQTQLIKFEYHVLYHISYAVPYLCFNAYKSNGVLLTLDDAWVLFKDHISNQPLHSNELNMLNVLTQMEHPILFKPFLTLHPCRIAEVLSQLPNCRNKVLSFLSIYGPSAFLTLELDYAKPFKQFGNNKEN